MRTRFTDLLKLREQEVEQIRREIERMDRLLTSTKDEIRTVESAFFSQGLPVSGDAALLARHRQIAGAYRVELEELRHREVTVEKQIQAI